MAYFAPHPMREICDTTIKERMMHFVMGFMVSLQIFDPILKGAHYRGSFENA